MEIILIMIALGISYALGHTIGKDFGYRQRMDEEWRASVGKEEE